MEVLGTFRAAQCDQLQNVEHEAELAAVCSDSIQRADALKSEWKNNWKLIKTRLEIHDLRESKAQLVENIRSTANMLGRLRQKEMARKRTCAGPMASNKK